MGKKKVVRKYSFQQESPVNIETFADNMRPKPSIDTKTNYTVALLIFVSTLVVYWITQNRSVTFWDVGEYIACSSILGIPHPPGNPFYIILGRFFCIIGLEIPHALMVNSISGLMSALAVMFTYLFTVKLVTMFEGSKTLVITAGVIAALYNAFSFTFWNNAVEASVYPGRDLTINLIIWLTLVWVERSRSFSHQNIFLLIIYIFFIGFSIHQTSLQLVPAVLFIALYPMLLESIKTSRFWVKAFIYFVIGLILYFVFIEIGKSYHVPDMAKIITAVFISFITYIHLKDRVESKAWLLGIAMIFIALSPHLYLLVRSELRPFINEGHPHNLELFTDYVLRRQYGVTSFMQRRVAAYQNLPFSYIRSYLYQFKHHFLRYFYWQFFHAETISGWTRIPSELIGLLSKLVVLFLGFFGIYYQARNNKHSFIYLLSFFIMTCFAMVFVMNLSDSEVRDRDYFFVSAYYLWGVWMAIGSIGLIRLLFANGERIRKSLLIAGVSIFIALPVINFASQYFVHNRSKEFIALDYGINFLNSVEENAIIFTNGDNDTFPLWYAQAVYDPNAYENIYPATTVYPDKESEEAVRKAVERKKRELRGIRPDVTIANLSLLNTPWYIRHLRDTEGVLFGIPDEHIDNLRPMRDNRDIPVTISSPGGEESFTVTIPAGKVMLIKDIAAIRIISHNFGRRPIYMAVTVADEIVFQDHLRNEGKVNRLVSRRGRDQINFERLKNNVDNVYSYRSIFDDNVHKDENMRKLVANYGAANMRISQYYHRQGNLEQSSEYLARAVSFIEDRNRFYPSIVDQFVRAGNYERALEYIEKVLENNPRDLRMYYEAVNIFIEEEDVEQAFSYLERAISNRVQSEELALFIISVSNNLDQHDRGIQLLNLMREYDENTNIDSLIKRLENLKD